MTLDQLHEFRICSLLYKIIQQCTLRYLYERLPFDLSQRTGVLISLLHNHTLYGKSFFVEDVGLWNSLPLEVRSSCNLEVFCFSCINPIKCILIVTGLLPRGSLFSIGCLNVEFLFEFHSRRRSFGCI
jgi:hypothetical protein